MITDLESLRAYPYAITHGGKFHADDVFSTAFLKMLVPKLSVRRVFNVPADFKGIVYDIGQGEFDHHQEGAPVRENGVRYAAFGLLWRAFGRELLRQGIPEESLDAEWQRFDEKFVCALDLDDNTGCGEPIADIIGQFNPLWDSTDKPDACFMRAVAFAKIILENKFAGIFGIYRAKKLVAEALEAADGGDIVTLNVYAPWRSVLIDSNAKFVVYPSQRGGWSAQVIPISLEDNTPRCAFPESWAGKPAEELPSISGIAGLRFCHHGRFLISTNTAAQAKQACRIALAKAAFEAMKNDEGKDA